MNAKTTTIAVITDLHYGAASILSRRRCQIADILLTRTVSRLNRLICPDVTLVLGDVLDDGHACDADKHLRRLGSILGTLNSPYIAIPGNHDGDPERFYRVIERPRDFEDIAGIRFVPFIDQGEPGYNASRNAADLDRICFARSGYDGPLIALQHVCLFPPDRQTAPYNYTNARDIIAVMQAAGVMLSVSGHCHHGAENTQDGDLTFVNAPGLCEAPFPFLEVTINNGKIRTLRHELASPEN